MQEADQTNVTFPERIHELAREHRVGEPVRVYRLSVFGLVIFLGAFLLLEVFSLSLSIYKYKFDSIAAQKSAQFYSNCQTCTQADRNGGSQFNASTLSSDVEFIWGAAGEFTIGLLGLLFIPHLRREDILYRCSEGLLRTTLRKRNIFALRWDEITEVYGDGGHIKILRNADSKQALDFTAFRHSQDIDECVESEVIPQIFSRSLEQYQQSGSVQFGHLSIRREGLVMNRPATSWKNDEIILWEELEDIRFTDGSLSIKRHGVWQLWAGSSRRQKHLSSAIPNPTVYVALAKYLLKNERIEGERIDE